MLAPAVLRQLARLGAPFDAAAPAAHVDYLNGAIVRAALPATLCVLHTVRWPTVGTEPFPLTHRKLRVELGLGGSSDSFRTRGHEGPLYVFGEDRDQHHYVIRVDDAASDPLVYRIDHDGSDLLEDGEPLSEFLAALSPIEAAPRLLSAIRDIGAHEVIAIVRADPRVAREPFEKKSGFAPIHLAVLTKNPDMVAALLEAGVAPGVPLRASTKRLASKYLGDLSWNLEKPDLATGETPLPQAEVAAPRRRPRNDS